MDFLLRAHETKYALRHLVQGVDAAGPFAALPYHTPRYVEAAVRPTLDCFDAARNHDSTIGVFTAARGGHAGFYVAGDGRTLMLKERDPRDRAFHALKVRLTGASVLPSAVVALSWVRGALAREGPAADLVGDIIRDAIAFGGHAVAYTHRSLLGRRMYASAERSPVGGGGHPRRNVHLAGRERRRIALLTIPRTTCWPCTSERSATGLFTPVRITLFWYIAPSCVHWPPTSTMGARSPAQPQVPAGTDVHPVPAADISRLTEHRNGPTVAIVAA